MVRFVDTAGVNPAVFQPIFPCLIGTKPQFGISCLVLTCPLLDVVKGDLIFVGALGVRQDGVYSGRCCLVLG